MSPVSPPVGSPGQVLRERLQVAPVLLPGVWDPLSALLAAQAGFPAMFVSGYCVAGTALGQPDIGLLTQDAMADIARRICAVVPDRSVVVDADTGYGNSLNVVRTVELWESAGAAGMFLEDQVWPKRCGHMGGKEVVERSDWLAKLRAALGTRSHLHITARTDARSVLGLAEAIERARMARDLGVDAVFVEAPESVGELEAIAAALEGVTLVANMVEFGRTPLLSLDELSSLGFRLVVSPVAAVFAAAKAIGGIYSQLRAAGTVRDGLGELISFDEFTSLVGLDELSVLRERFEV